MGNFFNLESQFTNSIYLNWSKVITKIFYNIISEWHFLWSIFRFRIYVILKCLMHKIFKFTLKQLYNYIIYFALISITVYYFALEILFIYYFVFKIFFIYYFAFKILFIYYLYIKLSFPVFSMLSCTRNEQKYFFIM